jgi:hypothetical protein
MVWIRSRMTFSNTISMIALFVALGGTSYAATQLAKNSVGAKQIRKNAVGAAEIKRNAVRSVDVKDGVLRLTDFAAGQIPTGATGPTGPAGPAGDKGDKGETGSVGVVSVQHTVADADVPDGTKASFDVFCPAGSQGIGGGARGDDFNSEATNVTSSRPVISTANNSPPLDGGSFTGWRVTVVNLAGGVTAGIRPEVWVVCAEAPAP